MSRIVAPSRRRLPRFAGWLVLVLFSSSALPQGAQRALANAVAQPSGMEPLAVGLDQQLAFITLEDPDKPRLLGLSAPLAGMVEDIHVEGDRTYVLSATGSLNVFDTADHTSPRRMAWIELGADAMAVEDQRAFLIQDGDLLIVDLSENPPRLMHRLYTPGHAERVRTGGGRVFVAESRSQSSHPSATGDVFVLNAEDGSAVARISLPDGRGYASDVLPIDDRMYATAWKGILECDISDLSQPQWLGGKFTKAIGVWPHDGFLLVHSVDNGGLHIYDRSPIRGPWNPRQALHVEGRERARVWSRDRHVYIGDSPSRLLIYEILDAGAVRVVGHWSPKIPTSTPRARTPTPHPSAERPIGATGARRLALPIVELGAMR